MPLENILSFFNKVDQYMYYPVLIVILAAGGLFFTFRTKFVQIRLIRDACRLIGEKAADKKISSFQALMVSTASRVGTGNIVGVATAICLGGPGACFWMWLMCIIGASSAFTESTLAQIYKRRGEDGNSYGGPAYYIEHALKKPWLSVVFCLFLIATYAFGFNLLCSYNLQSTFAAYSFYDAKKNSVYNRRGNRGRGRLLPARRRQKNNPSYRKNGARDGHIICADFTGCNHFSY